MERTYKQWRWQIICNCPLMSTIANWCKIHSLMLYVFELVGPHFHYSFKVFNGLKEAPCIVIFTQLQAMACGVFGPSIKLLPAPNDSGMHVSSRLRNGSATIPVTHRLFANWREVRPWVFKTTFKPKVWDAAEALPTAILFMCNSRDWWSAMAIDIVVSCKCTIYGLMILSQLSAQICFAHWWGDDKSPQLQGACQKAGWSRAGAGAIHLPTRNQSRQRHYVHVEVCHLQMRKIRFCCHHWVPPRYFISLFVCWSQLINQCQRTWHYQVGDHKCLWLGLTIQI